MALGAEPGSNSGTDGWLGCAHSAMSLVLSSLARAPFEEAMEFIDGAHGELDAVQGLLIAQRAQAGFSPTSTETLLKKSGKVSKGEAKKRTRRGTVIEKNPTLAKQLSQGDLSTEQVDLLAEASEKTEGEAAEDEELIAEIADANPDQGKAIIRRYIEEHTEQDDRNSRYDRQRRARKVYKSKTMGGLSRLTIEGDDESIDAMLLSLHKRADGLYRADGGRDLAHDKHPRTNDHRLFDAAHQQLTHTANTGTSRSGARPVMVLRSNIADLTNDPEVLKAWTVELIGSGLVPSSLASYYRCISELAIQLVDETGAVLKHGRTKRRVTPEQWVGLVSRDGGCVQCGAHHRRCEAHHLIPWTAPAKGETNIDEMVLLCVDCHHRLHENNHTMFQNASGKWCQRPATPAETPAAPPKQRGPTRKPRRVGPETRAATPTKQPQHSTAKERRDNQQRLNPRW